MHIVIPFFNCQIWGIEIEHLQTQVAEVVESAADTPEQISIYITLLLAFYVNVSQNLFKTW